MSTTRKSVARKPAAKKTTARKTVAKQPAAKRSVAAKPATRKTVAAKTTTKKPVAKRPAAKVVRHGTVKRTTTTARSNGAGIGIDRETLVRNLVKLSKSKQDAVALEATKTLLTIVK